jgi:hypothetical protein
MSTLDGRRLGRASFVVVRSGVESGFIDSSSKHVQMEGREQHIFFENHFVSSRGERGRRGDEGTQMMEPLEPSMDAMDEEREDWSASILEEKDSALEVELAEVESCIGPSGHFVDRQRAAADGT